MRRGDEFSIMTGGIELMNSRRSGSEAALATLACGRIADRRAPRILIGGLGMGFTLRAALPVLAADGEIVVAELVPAVAAWARGPMAHLFGASLQDPRLTLHVGDVGPLIGSAVSDYDAILLDVDNGPGGLDRKANDSLYSPAGLNAARRALRPGGVLAVWSATPDEAFVRRLRQTGYGVETCRIRATGRGRGARHTIWIATSA